MTNVRVGGCRLSGPSRQILLFVPAPEHQVHAQDKERISHGHGATINKRHFLLPKSVQA